MLEEKIAQLIQSIDILNVNLEMLRGQKGAAEGADAPPKAKTDKPKEEPKTETKETTVTREELHKLCLAIVRDKPDAKGKIQKVLSKRLVKDLKDDELESIKAKLEKI